MRRACVASHRNRDVRTSVTTLVECAHDTEELCLKLELFYTKHEQPSFQPIHSIIIYNTIFTECKSVIN